MQQVLRQIQEAVEPVLERSLTKRRRQEFLASAGPLFLCLTFIEDALRVLLRWKEQMSYMTVTMRMSGWLGGFLLIFSLVTQMTGSVLVLRPKEVKPSRVKVGCYTLLAFVFLQPFMYGQARDVNTFSCIPTSAREDAYSAELRCILHRIQLYSLYSHPSYSRAALNTLRNIVFPA